MIFMTRMVMPMCMFKVVLMRIAIIIVVMTLMTVMLMIVRVRMMTIMPAMTSTISVVIFFRIMLSHMTTTAISNTVMVMTVDEHSPRFVRLSSMSSMRQPTRGQRSVENDLGPAASG